MIVLVFLILLFFNNELIWFKGILWSFINLLLFKLVFLIVNWFVKYIESFLFENLGDLYILVINCKFEVIYFVFFCSFLIVVFLWFLFFFNLFVGIFKSGWFVGLWNCLINKILFLGVIVYIVIVLWWNISLCLDVLLLGNLILCIFKLIILLLYIIVLLIVFLFNFIFKYVFFNWFYKLINWIC